jgi:hypothetical protein
MQGTIKAAIQQIVVAFVPLPPCHDFVADRATRAFAWQGKFIF